MVGLKSKYKLKSVVHNRGSVTVDSRCWAELGTSVPSGLKNTQFRTIVYYNTDPATNAMLLGGPVGGWIATGRATSITGLQIAYWYYE